MAVSRRFVAATERAWSSCWPPTYPAWSYRRWGSSGRAGGAAARAGWPRTVNAVIFTFFVGLTFIAGLIDTFT